MSRWRAGIYHLIILWLAYRSTQVSHSNEQPFSPVAQSERRGPVTMGLLWITMVTAFPSVLIGFQWFKTGISLTQLLVCCLCSCLLLLAFTIPSVQLGAITGQSYAGLSRVVFGKLGSRLVTINLLWIFIAWYGLCSLFMAEAVHEFFHVNIPLPIMAGTFALLMALNNFFGFKGVANFARYFAAPILIAWVCYTFGKAIYSTPVSVLVEPSRVSFAAAFTAISSFIIGFALWGNEADYWRFSKAKMSFTVPPLVVALVIGEIIFPATGWMIARMTGVTEYAAATALMSRFSFGGIAIIAVIVLGASYFAANDSNLLGSSNACANIKPLPHKIWVTALAILGAMTASWLAVSGSAKGLETIASLNCIILPTPTVIIISEWAMASWVFGASGKFAERIPEFSELPLVRWPALVALSGGILAGLLTSGVIPGLESWKVGLCSVQCWFVAIALYVPLRMFEYKAAVASTRKTAIATARKALEGSTQEFAAADAPVAV